MPKSTSESTRGDNFIYALDKTAEHAGALHDSVRFLLDEVGVAAIVLPIVIMDHPMTILAVWPVWSAPRYCSLLDGVEAHVGLSQGSASAKSG